MTPKANNARGLLFSILFGCFLALALVKFGNPAILEKLIARPANPLEWLINSWPVAVGHILLAGLLILGIFTARIVRATPISPLSPPKRGEGQGEGHLADIERTKNVPRWLLWSPLIWFGWQCLATTRSLSPELSQATLLQFTACVVCFYLGLFALSPVKSTRPFFAILLVGLLIVIAVGWQQHFGGLKATREYFFAYVYPGLKEVPPEYLKKISSNRIFSTLFYPNALAGVLLLLLPMALALTRQPGVPMTDAARNFLTGLVGLAGLACMVWSGSKAGWLLMLLLGLVALLRLDFDRKWKLRLLALVFVVGLAGFGLRYAGYFKKGATSAAARADYWRAAAQTAAANPVFGTGPGTFAIPYKQLKKPESEMARLAHNDYLEQASDSGLIGFLAYTAFIFGSLWVIFRKVWAGTDWLRFSVWLGLFGWGLQGLTEFGLYIPAVAWPAFALFGWLLAAGNQFDTRPKTAYSPAQR